MAGLVGSILVSLSAKTDQFESGMQRARKEVAATADVVAKGSVHFDGLGKSLTKLTAKVASLATLKRGLDSVIASGTKMQQLESAFTVLTGSAQASDTVLAHVRATADKLGLSFADLADGFKGVNASAKGTILEGQGIERVFTQVVTASKALQLSGDDTRGILLALQQMLSKGKVSGEDFLQIAERLPGALNIGARALGVTTAEFTKMREAGEVLSTQFLPKFANQLEKELGGGAEQASKGFASAFERLGNATFDAGALVAKSGLLDWLGSVVTKLAEVVKAAPDAQRAIEKLAKAQTEKDLGPLAVSGMPASTTGQAAIAALNEQLAAKQLEIDRARKTSHWAFGPSGIEDVSASVLEQLQAEQAVLQRLKADLLKTTRRAGEKVAGQDEGLGAIGTSRYVAALDLGKTLVAQVKVAEDAVAQLREQMQLDPDNALKLVQEQISLIEKAVLSLDAALARGQKTFLPQLLGFGGAAGGAKAPSAAFPGAQPGDIARALPLIQAQAPQYGLDPNLVAAIAYRESGFNPNAISKAGAQGLMQLMPATAAGLGVKDSFDIQQNLTGALTLLKQLSEEFKGDIPLMLARYNASVKAVAAFQAGRAPLPGETQKYIPAVLATRDVLAAGQGTGAIAGVGGEAATAMTQVQGLRDQLVALKLQLKDIASVDDFLKAIVDLKDELLALQLASPDDLALAKLQALPARDKAAQDFKAQFAADPSGARERAFGQIITLQDQVAEATARKAVRDITQDQHTAVDELIRSLLQEQKALQATQTELSKTQQGTGAARDAEIAATLSLGHATEEEVRYAGAIRERNKVAQQAIIDSGNQAAVQATIAGLQAERDALLLTDNAKLASTLNKQQATTPDIARAQGLATEIKNLQRADQVAGTLINTFEQLALTGKISFASLAQEFGRLALSILFDAAGIRKALTSVAAQGIDWLGAALKLGTTAANVAGGVGGTDTSIGASSGAEFAAADTGSASTLFDTGGDFRAGGGTVQSGRAYLVGERGPEPFYPAVNGRILSHEEALDALQASRAASVPPAVGEPQTIIQLGGLHVHGVQDTSSFLRSRGEIQRAALQMLQQAQRAA